MQNTHNNVQLIREKSKEFYMIRGFKMADKERDLTIRGHTRLSREAGSF
jgi:hypothetical protein